MVFIHLLRFWYPESFNTLVRIWKNTLLVLEEDLAVGLMWKLIFTPLFHDSTLTGRFLSILFRLSRVLIGLIAFSVVSLLLFIASVFYLSVPFLMLIFLISLFIPLPYFGPLIVALTVLTFITSTAVFIYHEFHKGLKSLWKIKSLDDLWDTTKLSKKSATWDKLLQSEDVKNLLSTLEISPQNFSAQLRVVDDKTLEKVYELGKMTQAKNLTASFFWVAMLFQIEGHQTQLMKLNLKPKDFEGALKYQEEKRSKWRKIFIWNEDFAVTHLKGVNRGWLGAPTPALDSISTDITKAVSLKNFNKFIGRSSVLSEVITILSQVKDRNVLLVGPAGAGKTTLVYHLASLILKGDAPDAIASKRIVSIDINKLLSSVTSEGDLAKKIYDAFEEVKSIENIVIFIDELQNLGVGDAGKNLNLYSLLLPYLESDNFQFISSTEEDQYARVIERNSSFARIFHKVEVPPANEGDTISIIMEKAIDTSRYQNIEVTYLAIKEIVHKSQELLHDKVLPDSALSVLEECKTSPNGIINLNTVRTVLSKRVNVPVAELDEANKKLLLNLEEEIHKKLIDQEEAVKKVSDTLRRSATDLKDKGRPIGSFLFVGPTGVGKTELAKILAEIYFKKKGAYLRFDMSEYQTTESVNRLIGTSDQPGELTEAVKLRPYALLLLDEFEKAYPKILTLFLQVLEDGRLTDASGKTTDFTNTIIIATSNASSITIAEGIKKGRKLEELNGEVKGELMKIYKPELLNRFDEVVMFKPLSQEDLKKIVKNKLENLRLIMEDQGYPVIFSDDLITNLAKKGYDPVLGARPLRRLIQDTLEARLSRMILEGRINKGDTLNIDSTFLN